MARKKDRFRPRAGYERLPGRARRYRVVATGDVISRRQYIKRTEGVRSLEAKAKANAASRKTRPLTLAEINRQIKQEKFNEFTKLYKKANPGKKVRGPESEDFYKWYRILRTRTVIPGDPVQTKKNRALHIFALWHLGKISKEQRDRYLDEYGIDADYLRDVLGFSAEDMGELDDFYDEE